MAVLLRIADSVQQKELKKMDWLEVFSGGADPLAQAGTREEVGTKNL